jgi:hypothetical protein
MYKEHWVSSIPVMVLSMHMSWATVIPVWENFRRGRFALRLGSWRILFGIKDVPECENEPIFGLDFELFHI